VPETALDFESVGALADHQRGRCMSQRMEAQALEASLFRHPDPNAPTADVVPQESAAWRREGERRSRRAGKVFLEDRDQKAWELDRVTTGDGFCLGWRTDR
jgi:hypothetical protein